MMDLQNILNDEIAKAQGKSIAPSPKEIIKSQKEQEKAANKTVSTNPLAGVAAAVGTGAVEGVKSAASNAATMQSINTLKQEIGEIESARTRVQKAGTYTADMAQQMDEQIALRKARITNLIDAQRNKNAASDARLQAVDERYELGRVGEFMQDLGSAAGNMAPSLGIGLINPAAGLASFGMQAAAQSYGQALDEGATHEQAVRYGVSTGLKEAAIEKLTGGLGRFYGKGLIGNAVKNDSLKNVLLNTAKGAAGEGAEEALSGAIDPYLQRATYNPEAENATAEELAYQAAIGMALGTILGGSSNVLDYRVNKGTKKAAQGAEMGAGQAQTQSTINNTAEQNGGLKGEYGASISPNEGGIQGSETYSASQKPDTQPDTQTDNIYAEAYEEMMTGKGAAEKKALTEDEKKVKRFIQSAAIGARLDVKYEDLPTSRRAYYADGVLHINKNKLNEGMKVTAAHEIYHALEGTKEHEAVVELAIKARGGDAQSLIAQKIAEYARAGVTLDEAGARAEIGAEFIEKAMSDEATINRVLLENRTLAQRILRWIKDMLSVFEKRKTMSAEDLAEYKALLKARRQYEQGLAKLHEGKYEPFSGDVRNQAIKRTDDGRNFVEITDDFLAGVPQNDWVNETKKNLLQRFPDGIRVGNNLIKINKRSREELTYSQESQGLRRKDPNMYRDKLLATNNVDEILQSNRDYINEEIKHKRKDSIEQFARANLLLKIGQNKYSAEIVVGTKSDGEMILYDIVNMKVDNFTEKKMEQNSLPAHMRFGNSAPNNSIRNSVEKVNREKPNLEERLSGDDLLNAQDMIDEINAVGGEVDEKGYVTVYHATSKDNAEKIKKTGKMTAKEDGLFFSTKKDGEIRGYGDSIIELKIPVEKLVLDDIFDGELHFRLPLKNRNSITDVKEYLAENEKNLSQGRFAIDSDKYSYGDLIDQYGAMDKGMEPRVDVDVPKQTNEWDKTRRFTRTAMESENVSDEAKEAIADDLAGDIASGRFTYEPTSNEKLQEKANASIERNGYEGAKQGIFKKYRDNEAFKAEDVALLEQLIVKASAEGRTQDAVDMIGLAAMVGTEMGQSVQALSMLKRMTPEGRLKQMEFLRDRLNTKYGLTEEKQITINERYKRMLLNKDNTAEDIEKVQSYIIDDMAKQLPVSTKDKFDAWRYLAMLGNPRTHIRNTVGNAMNLTISRLNDQLAGIVEANLLKEGQRTRAAGRVSKELKEFARQDWETNGRRRTDMSNKYGERGQAERNKQVFKTKGLESLRKFNENALDAEDTLFKKKQYTYALSHYMKANNITPAEMEQGGIRAEAARKFAEDEAYRVTFQEYNALANALNRFESKKTDSKLEIGGQKLVKALLPFKRTPLNILKRGVEYSPVGLANGLSDMYKLLRKDEGNATAVITEITQGMTGSAIVVLGYFLAEMGVLTAGYDEENKRRQNYENQLGGQNYAITLPGGGTYTLDWAAPVVMPLFVGAAVYDDIVSRTDDDGAKSGLLQSVLHGLVKVTDPVLEMSCMDSLQSALESYGNEGATSNMFVSAAKSYLMQFVPTLSGQIARTIDETKRSTYAPSDSSYTKTGESLGRQFMNKVPGLSYSSEPALDVWGREREQAGGNVVGRAALNMISPGTYAPNNETATDKEIKRLYDVLGEDKVIPKTAAKYVTKKIDNKNRTFYLTAKEYTAFQKKYGQDNFKAVSELMRSSVYKEMSDADKAEAIAEIYDYNGKLAKTEFFKGRKVAYDEAESMKKTLAESGGWVGYFEVKQAFPDQSYKTAKKRKETCDRYGIDYTAYSESDAKISELKTANSARYEKAGDKTEANKRDIARYLASRRDLTDPQRQVLWEEIGNYKDTYKQTARRYGL